MKIFMQLKNCQFIEVCFVCACGKIQMMQKDMSWEMPAKFMTNNK